MVPHKLHIRIFCAGPTAIECQFTEILKSKQKASKTCTKKIHTEGTHNKKNKLQRKNKTGQFKLTAMLQKSHTYRKTHTYIVH